MALRVLLADESHTIKKVIQLSLQDYAVEVKSVNLGVDVIEVAKSFNPDIIFADVLLQKRNGYEVAKDIKTDNELKNIPVILMWSGFIEVDNGKFAECLADEQLEKPFEVERLRELIQQFVPKTKNHDLSQYLKFPDMPEMLEPQSQATSQDPSPNIPSAQELDLSDNLQSQSQWNMDSFEELPINDELDDFQPIQLSYQQEIETPVTLDVDADLIAKSNDDDSEWVQSSSANYKIDIDIDENQTAADDDLPVEHIVPDIDTDNIMIQGLSSEADKVSMKLKMAPAEPSLPEPTEDLDLEKTPLPGLRDTSPVNVVPQLSEDELLEIVKGQSRELLEKVVWQVVPEIATQMIERELNRLLAERESKNI